MDTLSEVALQAHCSRDDIIAITDQGAHVFLSTASTMPEANHDILIIRRYNEGRISVISDFKRSDDLTIGSI